MEDGRLFSMCLVSVKFAFAIPLFRCTVWVILVYIKYCALVHVLLKKCWLAVIECSSYALIIEGSRTRVSVTHKLNMGNCLKCSKTYCKGKV